MKTLALILAIFSLLPAARAFDVGGEGTRGGGDSCEVSYRYHLALALNWLKNGLDRAKLKAGEAGIIARLTAKREGGEYKILSQFTIRCTSKPILVSGKEKTAYSEALKPARFHTTVNIDRWFMPEDITRTSLAAHELLVIAGIEKTDDYHLSGNLLGDFGDTQIISKECSGWTYSGARVRFKLSRSSWEKSPADPLLGPFKASIVLEMRREDEKLDIDPHPVQDRLEMDLADGLYCRFNRSNDNLFSCRKGHPDAANSENPRVMESLLSPMGYRLVLEWEKLPLVSKTLQEINSWLWGARDSMSKAPGMEFFVSKPRMNGFVEEDQFTCKTKRVAVD